RVIRFDPGFQFATEPHPLSMKSEVLLLGRAEDVELKGLSRAAKAVGMLLGELHARDYPVLVIRGAEPGTEDRLKTDLIEQSGLPPECILVKQYEYGHEQIAADFRSANLLIMPSLVEGFGLAG